MFSCRSSNFHRSFCIGSPTRLLEKTLQVLCTGRAGGEDEDAIVSPLRALEAIFQFVGMQLWSPLAAVLLALLDAGHHVPNLQTESRWLAGLPL